MIEIFIVFTVYAYTVHNTQATQVILYHYNTVTGTNNITNPLFTLISITTLIFSSILYLRFCGQ